jgi:hypothetical protein
MYIQLRDLTKNEIIGVYNTLAEAESAAYEHKLYDVEYTVVHTAVYDSGTVDNALDEMGTYYQESSLPEHDEPELLRRVLIIEGSGVGSIYEMRTKKDQGKEVLELIRSNLGDHWVNPGELILRYDIGNLSITYQLSDRAGVSIFEYKILTDYLIEYHKGNDGLFSHNDYAEIKVGG